jgi:hypothetical protein
MFEADPNKILMRILLNCQESILWRVGGVSTNKFGKWCSLLLVIDEVRLTGKAVVEARKNLTGIAFYSAGDRKLRD